MAEEVLKIENLKVGFFSEKSRAIAVNDVNITVNRGEIFGIVGESGCGKSVTSMSVLKLISAPGKILDGSIRYHGENLLDVSEKRMQQEIRGNKIAMIFQEVSTSLNPLMRVGEQIMEPLILHKKMNRQEAKEKALEMLRQVGVPLPEKRFYEYPHTMSGGMRQRVMIAIAMSCEPEVLIADEPTTALDVTTQAQILKLMRDLRTKHATSILLISHDLGLIANMCDRMAVMYCGTVVEQGTSQEVLKTPQHPYTQGLIASIPRVHAKTETLYSIPGTVPVNTGNMQGCCFADRCNRCRDICRNEVPTIRWLNDAHSVCCHYPGGGLSE